MVIKKNKTDISQTESAEDNITAYIKSVSLRKKLFGVSEEDIWTVVSNIQKYFEAKSGQDEAVIQELRSEIAEKDALITKQTQYVNAARRRLNGAE